MANERRIGASDSQSRAHLLDVAEAMMLAEGYSAVTSRKLGQRAGVSPQLVHYYFRTMDELFVEVFRRRAEENLARIAAALEGDSSLLAIWKLTSNPLGAAFNVEFAALANHRKEIRSEIATYGERFRRLQHDAVASRLDVLGVDPGTCPPSAVLLAMTGMATVMSIEETMGLTAGHREAREFVERFLGDLDSGTRPTT
ncbi:MAG: TetR/AcrR family transcriptional regulator [Microthrixaceae bacterium]